MLIITGIMNNPITPIKTVTFDDAFSNTENDNAYYINKAMKFDTRAEFIKDCEPLTYGEDFYKRI